MTPFCNNRVARGRVGRYLPVFLVGSFALLVFGANAANASASSTKIIIAGKEARLSAKAFVENGTVYVPVDFVKLLGATYSVSDDDATATVTSSGGRTWIGPCDNRDDQVFIPAGQAVEALGSDFEWDDAIRTATIRAKIKMVRENNNQLQVTTSFPVSYHVDSVPNPNRIFVDVSDASLGAPYTTIPVSGDDVIAVRENQMTPDTVRIALDLREPLTYTVNTASQSNNIQIAMADVPTPPDAPAPPAPVSISPDQTASANQVASVPTPSDMDRTANSTAVAGAALHISDIQYGLSKGALQITVTTSGPAAGKTKPYKAFLLDNPNRLALDLPGSDVALPPALSNIASATLPLYTELVKSIRWGLVKNQGSTPFGRIVVDLNKPVSYTVSSSLVTGGVRYLISIITGEEPSEVKNPIIAAIAPPTVIAPPPVPGNVLSGKVIVVDPGHGGHDGGAPGVNGLNEKDVVLPIGKMLRDQLIACGAKVIMTRSDDTFISLPERAQIGIDNNADLFISIHSDSSGSRNSHNGTSVYYHANLLGCRNLAQSVQDRLDQLDDGIVGRGIRSDYVRFPGVGFSVLRRSPEPAILVETGYVNSDHDASVLTNSAMQKLIAEGIVAGLKDYFVHEPDGISRSASSEGASPAVVAVAQKSSDDDSGDSTSTDSQSASDSSN